MSTEGPKPYPVVYDAPSGSIQYGFQDGYYTIPEAPANSITALTGDVTATGPGSAAATVASVGGSTAASVHTSQLLTASATNAATPSTLVLRDSSGQAIFTEVSISNTGATASLDLQCMQATGISAVIAHNESNSYQAYFGIANSNYGDALLRNSPLIISAALAKPLVIETLGVLMPLFTTTNKNAISSPNAGTVVYDTTLNKLSVFTGSVWETVTSA